jgi:uncharacterized membrane protein YeaQ/YmgE (transglycosylase-associated protein family)
MALFGSDNWIDIVFVGLLAGIVARLPKPGRERMGIILTTLHGIAGALLAAWTGQQTGWYTRGQPVGFIGALPGAIPNLVLAGLARGKR